MISRIHIERENLWSGPFQVAIVVAIGAFLGVLLTFSLVAAILLAGLVLAFGLLTLEDRLVDLFLVSLGGILVGYMFFGRGFAYAGIPPLFVSELVLGLGALTLFYTFTPRQLSFTHVLIIVFMAWGIVRTIPYLQTYGIDALRDAVVWGYAIFALVISNVVSIRFFEKLVSGFARLIPVFLIWTPILAVLTLLLVVPVWPQSGIAIAIFEPGDTAVHLSGMAALVISGMYYSHGLANRLPSSVFWALSIVCFGFVAGLNRAGLLTLFAGIGAAFFLWPSRQVLSFLNVVAVVGVLVIVINPNIEIAGVSRHIGPDQIVHNVKSILGKSDNDGAAGLQDTKSWRQRWWEKVWGYTVRGPYFLEGKGFGINLADDDGFQDGAGGTLRSPHNGHVTILARMGVPGLALWILIQGWFGFALYRAFLKAKEVGSLFWARIDVCLLIYWMAMLINMSFDVYLEGPQGGIWFWSIVGLGLGALRLQSQTADQPQTVLRPSELRRH